MLTKIFQAKAQNGKVSITDSITDAVTDKVSNEVCVKVPNADILSAGKAASKGILIISEDKKVYIALPMDSISKILDLLETAISKIVADVPITIAPNTGAVVAAALYADMQPVINQIKQLKENLQ
jgi:hypothetical protein